MYSGVGARNTGKEKKGPYETKYYDAIGIKTTPDFDNWDRLKDFYTKEMKTDKIKERIEKEQQESRN